MLDAEGMFATKPLRLESGNLVAMAWARYGRAVTWKSSNWEAAPYTKTTIHAKTAQLLNLSFGTVSLQPTNEARVWRDYSLTRVARLSEIDLERPVVARKRGAF